MDAPRAFDDNGGVIERDRWHEAWAALGVPPPAAVLDELTARYGEPHRAYHTLQHLRECFAELDAVVGHAARPAEVQLALWFHDAIYDTRAHDNEERSGRWAREVLGAAGVDAAAAGRVEALVLATWRVRVYKRAGS